MMIYAPCLSITIGMDFLYTVKWRERVELRRTRSSKKKLRRDKLHSSSVAQRSPNNMVGNLMLNKTSRNWHKHFMWHVIKVASPLLDYVLYHSYITARKHNPLSQLQFVSTSRRCLQFFFQPHGGPMGKHIYSPQRTLSYLLCTFTISRRGWSRFSQILLELESYFIVLQEQLRVSMFLFKRSICMLSSLWPWCWHKGAEITLVKDCVFLIYNSYIVQVADLY